MNEVNSNEKKGENEDSKKHIEVNIGLLAGLFGGAVLGSLIGAVFHDIPLYTGLGMVLGMAISFDLAAYIKGKREKNEKRDEMRE